MSFELYFIVNWFCSTCKIIPSIRLIVLIDELKSNISEDSIIKIIDIKRVNGNSLDNIDFSTRLV